MQIPGNTLRLPATSIVRLSPLRPAAAGPERRGEETVLAAVRFPPRAAEIKPLGALLPQVLAAYGLAGAQEHTAERFEAVA